MQISGQETQDTTDPLLSEKKWCMHRQNCGMPNG